MAMSNSERHSGPVTLRGLVVKSGTADQALLDSRGRPDWKTKDAWRTLRILSEFVEGFETLADLPPAVSVFGSARAKPDSPACSSRRPACRSKRASPLPPSRSSARTSPVRARFE